ncbi:hypothetical protein, partial [Azohydromonas australica]|uniref:hypothetical protein n=1 Tax=Azohydromonas australica TaxID=364039 RepID=UPI001B7FCC45
ESRAIAHLRVAANDLSWRIQRSASSAVLVFLRTIDRRRGTVDSLSGINYGPVELRLRELLALLNWRRWWR